MKKKLNLLLACIAVLGMSHANAQTYGIWTGTKDKTYWEYDFKGAEKKFSTSISSQASITAKGSTGFLPEAIGATVRVSQANSGGGDIEIGNSKLTVTASSANLPVKFSAYGITKATPVSSLFFDISFNSTTATNGIIVLGIGNSASNPVYTNYSQLTGSAQAGLFTGLHFVVGENIVTPRYRFLNTKTGVYSYSALQPEVLRKSGTFSVEIYSNNSANEQEYTRGDVVSKLPSKTFNIYINGIALKSAGNANIQATDEGALGSNLDAIIINGSNNSTPTENSLSYSISNLKMGGFKPKN